MYTSRILDGSPEDIVSPSFRLVNFSDEGAIVLVSTHLRHAWTAAPGADVGPGAVGAFIAASHNRSEEERKAIPQNNNKEDAHTPWRDEIYNQWNHVFYDVANFLSSVGPGTGHLHPPAHDVFALNYSVAGVDGGSSAKVWNYNILVIPAHLEPDVSVRMSIVKQDGEEITVGTFNASTPADTWYIKMGTNVRFFVEGDYENVRGGVAAILVFGRLDLTCPISHGGAVTGEETYEEEMDDEEEEEEEEEDDEEDNQAEDEDGDGDEEDHDEDEDRHEDEYEQSNDEWEEDTTEEVVTSQILRNSSEIPRP